MSRGVLLFAFNGPHTDYCRMAVYTAKRINHFLNLPVTVVTDSNNTFGDYKYKFDNVLIRTVDTTNTRDNVPWYNKGRFQAYDVTPYDETIVLDTDYLVNSNTLLKIFDLYDDFMCHNSTSFLLEPNAIQERMSATSFNTLWATVIAFKKTNRTKQIFECMEMVQNNYNHYSALHGFIGGTYRNDYSLTLALRMVNGHLENQSDYIPWHLTHLGPHSLAYKDTNKFYNTSYTIMHPNNHANRMDYISVDNTDFHIINKRNFSEIMDG